MGKDSEDDEKVEIERVAESPNISTNSGDFSESKETISADPESKTAIFVWHKKYTYAKIISNGRNFE